MSGLLGDIMTPQMEEAINEQQQPAGGITEQIARAQHSAILEKQERKAKERLQRSVVKRDRNRKKNKLSRAARRKNR